MVPKDYSLFELSGRECDKEAIVAEIVKFPYNVDSGAFTSVVPRSLIDKKIL